MAASGGPLGTGGMATKIAAAKKACASGIATVIADGRRPGVLDGGARRARRDVGTFFRPVADRLARRKHWIAYTLKPGGAVVVDDGARSAIVDRGRSLLPSGLREVRGELRRRRLRAVPRSRRAASSRAGSRATAPPSSTRSRAGTRARSKPRSATK